MNPRVELRWDMAKGEKKKQELVGELLGSCILNLCFLLQTQPLHEDFIASEPQATSNRCRV